MAASSAGGSELPIEKLRYEVVEWSNYSAGYHPRLIMENKPEEQSSRWLSETVRPPQYVTLQLMRPAIVTFIRFGKFHRPHACNIRKIRILGGMRMGVMTTLCEGELRNDGLSETLTLRHEVNGKDFPCLYIKIEPIDTWGQTNFSLWYIELSGCDDPVYVEVAASGLKEYQQKEALRLCLKHLRQYDYHEAYQALSKQAHLELEHTLLTQLHNSLVEKGEHSEAEKILSQAAADGLLDSHIENQPRKAKWQKISFASSEGHSWPGMRGGHQLCVDSTSQILYMFGGWDGEQDLADLWSYDIVRGKWTCLCRDSSEEGGPSPRSCHKMCLDSDNQVLYILGQYLDQDTRTSLFTVTIPGNFYSYHIPTNSWKQISSDTQADGGPRLLFDHQMCFNPLNKTLYIFGGRVITSLLQEGIGTTIYSGLYSYNCVDEKWACLRPDYTGGMYPHQLVPRMAHTMVLHIANQELYILGGQRQKQPLSDMWVYNISSDIATPLADGKDTHIPAAGFTVRASLEPQNAEIYLHLGMSHRENHCHSSDITHSNSLWVYTIKEKEWTQMKSSSPLPCPRFAHQLVLDPYKQVHYMFGGNPGGGQMVSARLDDLWIMEVDQASRKKLLHESIFMIRKEKYLELVFTEPTEALHYLKTDLAECVDHTDSERSSEFRKLTSELFSKENKPMSNREARSQLFDYISSLFPEKLSQPRKDIINFIEY